MSSLLDVDFSSNRTFITLNNVDHYLGMQQVLAMLYTWSRNPLYYGYASEEEFYRSIEFMRKAFTGKHIDLFEEVGKWPRNLRRRFARLEKGG